MPTTSTANNSHRSVSNDCRARLGRNPPFSFSGSFITAIALVASLVFIFIISFAFLGAAIDEEHTQLVLQTVAQRTPGIILVGESVDVDVDEPSVTIRWSILSCGYNSFLPGSQGIHGTQLCGLPTEPLYVFVDADSTPAATYNPSLIPFDRETGLRRSIQNLVQFDSDHVLDVHKSPLYPFDTYLLSSTIQLVSFNNETLPIRKIATIASTSSFNIDTYDMESYAISKNNHKTSTRDFDMVIYRPVIARVITLLLFSSSWVLTHVTVGIALIARRSLNMNGVFMKLVVSSAVLAILPCLRHSMPDAPGLDGVLIDSIGFFPQMIITGFSVVAIVLHLISQELDNLRENKTDYFLHPTFAPFFNDKK